MNQNERERDRERDRQREKETERGKRRNAMSTKLWRMLFIKQLTITYFIKLSYDICLIDTIFYQTGRGS